MEEPGSSLRCRTARMIGSWPMAAVLLFYIGGTDAPGGQFLASHPSLAGRGSFESVAVPVEGNMLVTVVALGANTNAPLLRSGNQSIPIRVVGYDPVTRLNFLQPKSESVGLPAEWLDDARGSVGSPLRAEGPGGPMKCLAAGWVKQIGGKVLPLALLQVNFDQAVPPAGTPLQDSQGKIVAIVFQAAGSGNTGYAIPAEAVHRVRRDLCTKGRLVRGLLGLALNSESRSPRVVRVLPKSPAAEAGVLPGDVLLAVGSRQITDYADAANAFFYLIPGQATQIKLLRGGKPLAFSLTPVEA